MFISNVQRVVADKEETRVSNSYQEHDTRKEAFDRAFTALKASKHPKGNVYYANRMYTVVV